MAGSSDGSPDHGKCLEAEGALDKYKSSGWFMEGILGPVGKTDPAVLVEMAACPEEMASILEFLFCLIVCLRMLPRERLTGNDLEKGVFGPER